MRAGAYPQPSDERRRSRRHQKTSRRTQDPLPKSATGRKLAELFPNGWDWIYASAPHPDESPQWETIGQFPLTPIELEQLHQDPESLVGIRPNAQSRWLVIDIDHHSLYHPSHNPQWLPRIQEMLEDIGICRTLLCQSSFSGGLHLYLPLPQPVSSYWLSICIKLNLEAIGIKLIGGDCEIYPNPKRYVPKGQGYSKYAAIRLPMQPESGFYPLDADLNPLPWTLDQWLAAFEQAASHQDIETFTRALTDSQETYKLRRHHHPKTLNSWQQRNDQEKAQGWTGAGQTNAKLKVFACEARVFMGMDSVEQIANYVEETARNSPGFYQHSRHVHELPRRCKDIAYWAMRYYWPNGTTPLRETKYHSRETAPADFNYHQAKRNAASHRIKEAVTQLVEEERLPKKVCDRAKAIIELSHVSQQTLYKAHNKSLWHPKEYQAPPTSKQSQTQSERDITQQPSKNRKGGVSQPLKLLLHIVISQLLIQVGFVYALLKISAATALALKGQRAGQAALGLQNLEEGGESEGGSIAHQRAEVAHIENWQQLQLSLPERFRRKIEQVKSNLRSPKVVQLPLPQQLETDPTADNEGSRIGEGCDRRIKPLLMQPEMPVVLTEADVGPLRSPSEKEEREFSVWFDLAVQVGIVFDSEWQEGEYWVEAFDGWHPFAEIVATFSVSALNRILENKLI
ncbi:hypothetical protein C1752_12231 [Acaryochloris thomasi RCC1774]|uniref:Uncharacterized protein n=1 Tax=Acaryochloris thomasi RCC1774 TaxID=1764569 RepID=A0A2W1J8G0_9CYAN|nr:hypothetical protein [Acaryochloris thomasi]PZD70448.1 hypothetical protein C1752_12231 [Acaryochloris thomasi RCC1774]